MSDKSNAIIEAAMELSREERAELAVRLLDTLEDDDEEVDQTEIDAAWVAESERRYQACSKGEMKSAPRLRKSWKSLNREEAPECRRRSVQGLR